MKKKIIVLILIFIISLLSINFFVAINIINKYNSSIIDVSNTLLYNLSNKYDNYENLENKVIKDIFVNNETISNDDILNKYGINKSELISNYNILGFNDFILTYIFYSSLILVIIVIFLIIYYINSRNKEIYKLNNYIDEILNNNYTLDIRDNEEDEFSILKNKIYDMTVMLKEQNRLLEKEKAEQEKLMADISHQLKTPITSMYILNDLMYENIPENKKYEFLDKMSNELKKISWLIKNLLNLAKLDSKTISLKKENINLNTFLENCKNSFSYILESQAVNIDINKDKDNSNEDIYVTIDLKWTSEAINNLIKNAIEHGAKNISISTLKTHLYVQITVSDDGEGISKEDIPHVFTRFYKAKNSKNDSVGLGLAFTKKIIENQLGEIRILSEEGIGTKFIIKFYVT